MAEEKENQTRNATYIILAIVPKDEKAIANRFGALSTGDRADLQSFKIPLSPTGEEPVTHWGLCTGADEQMRRQLGMAIMGNFWFWTIDAMTGLQLAINSPSPFSRPTWNVETFPIDVFDSVGLKRVNPPSIPVPTTEKL